MRHLPSVLSDDEVRARREELGRRLIGHRTRAGLSQERLAELAGVERKSISRAEGGVHAPSLDFVIRVAKVLDITEGELLAES